MMMKVLLAIFPVTAFAAPQLRAPLKLQSMFRDWMKEFDREYESTKVFLERLEIWAENHFLIEAHNSQEPPASYTLGHNQFSDMTWDEYKKFNKLGEYSPGTLMEREPVKVDVSMTRRLLEDGDLPEEINWVKAGAIPPVKNQGMCGSCWAFSAIGAIEGKHFIDTGVLVALSEQQLVDCDPLDMGCGGGLMDNAFLFDENSTGICSEEDYPYVMHKRWFRGCAIEKGFCEGVDHTRVDTFIDVNNTVDDLMTALVDQPVSIAIEADQQSFQFYKSGVYADKMCGENLDHGVLAVGYGTENGTDYFLVRNSWGSTWGDEGYVKMARHSPHVNGTCGILSWASRPLLREDY